MDNRIRLLIADDHPVVRDGLRAMISVEPDIEIVCEASTGAECLECYFRLRPAVTIVDLLLPDMDGIDIIRQICGKSSDAQIIVLTTLGGDADVYRALEAGARGYLFKDMARKDLVKAIRIVHQGQRFIAPQVGARLAEHLPRLDLTAREIEVLQLVASGMKNKEIAFKITVSEATVNAHVKHILEKLNAADRTQAVTTGLRRGIIKL